MSILADIKRDIPDLPKIQQQIGRFVLMYPSRVIKMSITTLANNSRARSEASVVKFYKNMGFSGYHDFKVSLATEIASRKSADSCDFVEISPKDAIGEVRDKIINSAIHVLQLNNEDRLNANLEVVCSMIRAAKRIIVLGYGSSGVAAFDFSVKMARLGINCQFSHDEHLSAMWLANSQKGDLLLCFSFSGETKSIVSQAQAVKERMPVISITGEINSQLASISDVCLQLESFSTTYRTDSILCRYVDLAIIDMIFTYLMQKDPESGEKRLLNSRKGLSFLKF